MCYSFSHGHPTTKLALPDVEGPASAPSPTTTQTGLPDRRAGAFLKGFTVKHSHLQTPRTLAESSFTVGYPTLYRYERQARRSDVLLVVVCAAVAGLILLGVI